MNTSQILSMLGTLLAPTLVTYYFVRMFLPRKPRIRYFLPCFFVAWIMAFFASVVGMGLVSSFTGDDSFAALFSDNLWMQWLSGVAGALSGFAILRGIGERAWVPPVSSGSGVVEPRSTMPPAAVGSTADPGLAERVPAHNSRVRKSLATGRFILVVALGSLIAVVGVLGVASAPSDPTLGEWLALGVAGALAAAAFGVAASNRMGRGRAFLCGTAILLLLGFWSLNAADVMEELVTRSPEVAAQAGIDSALAESMIATDVRTARYAFGAGAGFLLLGLVLLFWPASRRAAPTHGQPEPHPNRSAPAGTQGAGVGGLRRVTQRARMGWVAGAVTLSAVLIALWASGRPDEPEVEQSVATAEPVASRGDARSGVPPPQTQTGEEDKWWLRPAAESRGAGSARAANTAVAVEPPGDRAWYQDREGEDRYFKGFRCSTPDCAEHHAGYDFAKETLILLCCPIVIDFRGIDDAAAADDFVGRV